MIGDRLASGATSAIFGPNEGTKITQEKWDSAFEGFDAEDFKKKKKRFQVEEGATTGRKERTRSGAAN